MEKDRIIRVSDNLKKEIASFIQNSELKDSCGFISINHVETSRDLSKAKVFFSTINSDLSEKDLEKFLNNNSWKVRKNLSNLLPLKKVPELRFFYDSHIENVRKIDSLFDNLD
jgi:ribosome-binding factor A|tara:strand:- start:1622 stop:1960 length:339 start_codon:yes stop_codon:yes gene_type:complete